MNLPRSKVQQFLLLAFIPVLFAVILGMIFFGDHIFYTQYPAFQFLWSAVIASLFYHLLVFTRPRDAYLGLIILFILTLVTTQSTRPAYIIRDILYVAAIAAAVLFYKKYVQKPGQAHDFISALTFAGVYAVAAIIGGELNLIVVRAFGFEMFNEGVAYAASTGAFYGTTIGFAVGAGIVVCGNIFTSPVHSEPV